jgi:hypothetical protein
MQNIALDTMQCIYIEQVLATENYAHSGRRKTPLQRLLSISHLQPTTCLFYLVVLLAVEDPEDSEEQVDDVQVQADRSRDLFFNMIMSHNQLRINQDIAAEDQSRDHAVDELDSLAAREERGHESEDDEDPERADTASSL